MIGVSVTYSGQISTGGAESLIGASAEASGKLFDRAVNIAALMAIACVLLRLTHIFKIGV